MLHAQAKHLSKDQAKVLKAVEQDMKHSTGGTAQHKAARAPPDPDPLTLTLTVTVTVARRPGFGPTLTPPKPEPEPEA